MWVEFKSFEKKNDLVSKRTGNTYEGYILKGIKKGYQETPDADWERVFLDNSLVTTIEYGVERPNQPAVQYIQHNYAPGDIMIMKFKLVKGIQQLQSIEKFGERAGSVGAYTPLTPESAAAIKNNQVVSQQITNGSESTPPWIV